ncbi:MAG TPA: hypothetical protein VMW72_13665 [Sedimentisphaerales bacterium]|nr:hypothetical protein [Sedimentisphaerales bacterium]
MRKRLSKKESWFKENNFTAEDEIYFGVDVNKVHYHVAISSAQSQIPQKDLSVFMPGSKEVLQARLFCRKLVVRIGF